MTIADDYNPNYDFATCQDWIEWINKQHILLGQPCVKEDKKSRLLSLENRVHNICLVQPANRRFNPEIRRMYLPKGVDQFIDFLRYMNISLSIIIEDEGYRVRVDNSAFVESSDNLMKIMGKLVQQLKKEKKLK